MRYAIVNLNIQYQNKKYSTENKEENCTIKHHFRFLFYFVSFLKKK